LRAHAHVARAARRARLDESKDLTLEKRRLCKSPM